MLSKNKYEIGSYVLIKDTQTIEKIENIIRWENKTYYYIRNRFFLEKALSLPDLKKVHPKAFAFFKTLGG